VVSIERTEILQDSLMLAFLTAGIVLGLSAGFSPGPLMTLVLSQTIRHGTREGVKVALAPLVTDLPIILLSLLVLSRLSQFTSVLGVLSLLGGLYILFLAYESLRAEGLAVEAGDRGPQSFGRGVLVNALNPHPYLFWLTVGGPVMLKAWAESPASAVLFIAGFSGCLVGSKIFLALLAGRTRHLLNDRTYRVLMRVLGALLVLFALLLLREGLALMGVFS
jgi:threonine/homoserine/homoserine lactone efflux protein